MSKDYAERAAISDAKKKLWDESPEVMPYIEATVKELGLKDKVPDHLVDSIRRLAHGAMALDTAQAAHVADAPGMVVEERKTDNQVLPDRDEAFEQWHLNKAELDNADLAYREAWNACWSHVQERLRVEAEKLRKRADALENVLRWMDLGCSYQNSIVRIRCFAKGVPKAQWCHNCIAHDLIYGEKVSRSTPDSKGVER